MLIKEIMQKRIKKNLSTNTFDISLSISIDMVSNIWSPFALSSGSLSVLEKNLLSVI